MHRMFLLQCKCVQNSGMGDDAESRRECVCVAGGHSIGMGTGAEGAARELRQLRGRSRRAVARDGRSIATTSRPCWMSHLGTYHVCPWRRLERPCGPWAPCARVGGAQDKLEKGTMEVRRNKKPSRRQKTVAPPSRRFSSRACSPTGTPSRLLGPALCRLCEERERLACTR